MSAKTGCFKGSVRVFSRPDRVLEDGDVQKRRRVVKTQIAKRLKSWHNWQLHRARMERRTTARESTIALLRKSRNRRDNIESHESSIPVDPITREKLSGESAHVFTFKRGNSFTKVDAAALIDYILATGDYTDPESRIPFDDVALRRLDQIGQRLGKPSVVKARAELEAKFEERQFFRDALCGLERVCGEAVAQMFDLVEMVNEKKLTLEDAHMQLLTDILPEFQDNFSQLCEANKEVARQTAAQFEAFLRGPPNKPIKSTPIHKLVLELFTNSVNAGLD